MSDLHDIVGGIKIPKDPNEIVDVISLSYTQSNNILSEESDTLSNIRIRVKIKGRYYVGHLELNE